MSASIGADFHTLDRLFSLEVAPEDVNTEYNIPGLGTMYIPILETKFLIDGVAYFRPYIRAFLVLLLVLYNWNNVLKLIDQDAGIAHTTESTTKKEKID